MHFPSSAKGMLACPGGFGTMNERCKILTLVQTSKMARVPIMLVGTGLWQRAINVGFLVQEGTVAREDLDLFTLVETADEAVNALEGFDGGRPPP
jgi:predicted Rossmann-fold nucleotide-binding protein